MSVYNRKMFKRNARNALNASAGIKAPVQTFHAGGPVGHTHPNVFQRFLNAPNTFSGVANALRGPNMTNAQAVSAARSASPALNARMNLIEGGATAPLTQLMKGTQIQMTPGSLSGIAGALKPTPQSEQSRFPVYSQPNRGLSSLVYSKTPPVTQGGALMQDIGTGVLNTMDMIGAGGADIVSGIVSPFTSDELNPAFVDQVVKGKATLPADTVQQINAGEIKVPPTLAEALLSGKISASGLDLAKLEGFYQDQEVADVSQIMRSAPGSQTIAVQKTIDRRGPDGQYDGDDLGNAPSTTPPVTDTTGEDATGGAPSGAGDDGSDTAGDTTATTTTETTTTETEITPKEEIERVINQGTQEEQQDQLKQLMAEFTENVPEYKGIDKGLAMAKIGFAMAAGKSPRAIENIAAAMEQGADMLIKDQSKKDEFNRQVQLSALQYGLKDIAAERQLKRSAEFQTSDYVLMPGQTYTYPDGRTITGGEGGTTISLRKSDILENGLPDGVQGTSMATALLNKKATLSAAIEKAKLDGIKSRTLDTPKKITEFVDDYDASVTDVINSNNAIHLTKQVMIANAEGKITGFQPGFDSMLAKAMTLAGVDATNYTDRDLAIADLRKVFQKLVPLTLGKDQSANSISDKDVNRLADAYMSDAILSGGIMGLMTTPANVLDSKLGGVLVEFENAQKSALDRLNSLEATGAEFLTPSGSALGERVSKQRQRLQPFLPQGSRAMLSIGDDGIYRLSK